MQLTHQGDVLLSRPSKFIETDARVVRWIAQAAINVELFTIPLYMTSLYSITGMHPITGAGNSFYKGRIWPGAKTSAFPDPTPGKPGWGNKQAFNIVFSVFIQEMLHLQMAANIATAIGAKPDFTDPALQDADNGWICYGPALTAIPTIVNLTDTDTYTNVKVNVGPLDADRIQLFLAIEQPFEDAEEDIVRNRDQYFPQVPFTDDPDWDPATFDKMFGSIGYMYQCYRDYLTITYDNGTTLWDNVFDPNGQQNDLFNNFSFPGHPMREFMGFETTIALTDRDIALKQALNMMNAITDQGEGSTLKVRQKHAAEAGLLMAVEPQYCPSDDALKSDYPSYSDTGRQIPSSDAVARFDNDDKDHYERFQEVLDLMEKGGVLTWDRAGKTGNWTAADLTTADYDPNDNPYGLPTPEQVADALNALAHHDARQVNYETLSQAVVGSIKGVTTVLNDYWAGTGSFPFPSMAGSGDRMSTAWAVFGATPDLSKGIPSPDTNILNHACQGLSLDGTSPGSNSCALTDIYHTCRGSNDCKGMGGCGFVQASTGGGSCGSTSGCGTAKAAPQPAIAAGVPGANCAAAKMRMLGGLCGGPTPTPTPSTTYTAPSDNICKGFGGCAVPISAMQLYPKAGTMDVYALAVKSSCGTPTPSKCGTPAPSGCGTPTPSPTPSGCGTPTPTPTPHGCGAQAEAGTGKNLCGTPPPPPPSNCGTPTPSSCSTPTSKKIGTIDFAVGDKVEDIAFKAFSMVLQAKGQPVPAQQQPDNLRLAFPPST
ncbi:ferritin-like protein [Sphingomonas sp. LB-2]|uniref:ferritin-like protein n=1 Tax=Sphingomonas caeni TaxID=2984949 RepID=UPI00222F6D26|nr:ferritin-like protein [Sphingomonas caeni]MCW3847109.1 ferritin-like protein [Sphingomonas caeni]